VDIHTRVVIPTPAHWKMRIIAVLGMVEAFPHEFGKGYGSACADAGGQYSREAFTPNAFREG